MTMKEQLKERLNKVLGRRDRREGYEDYLREAISTCVLSPSDDYLTAEYVAYELYLNWKVTGQLDTVSPFLRVAKLFDRNKAYYRGVRTAFDDVWVKIFEYQELFHDHDFKDDF